MKRLSRDPLRFDGFSLFATYGQKESLSLRDPASIGGFVAAMKASAERALTSESFLHGQRTEALFERIVAGLGGCRLLKREDVGEVFHTFDGEIQPPDFRVVLNDGKQFLIEVKNFYQGEAPRKEQREATKYLDALTTYSEAMGCELRIATYWSRWNRWTLVPVSAFQRGVKRSTLSLADALIANEMSRLGDVLVGTRSPLRFRVNADTDCPRTIGPDGKATFTIKSCEMRCEDRKITNPVERRIAVFLFLFGDWALSDSPVETDGDQIVAVEHHVAPPEECGELEDKGFEMIGTLSSMISKQHNSATGEEGQVQRVHVEFQPGAIGALIPKDYKGEALPLWRFEIQGSGSPSSADS